MSIMSEPEECPGTSASTHAELIEQRGRMIVTAAYDLLHEEGLEGLTIRAVLKRTGLARRAFYESFAGKDDLVLAVFRQSLHSAADYFRAQHPEGNDPLTGIKLVIDSLVLGSIGTNANTPASAPSDKRGAALSREHLRLSEARPAELQAALAPLLDLIAELLNAAMACGQVRPCDAELQARLIYNLVATTVHTELLTKEGEQPDPARRLRLAGEIWEFCRRAIQAEANLAGTN